MIQYINLKNSTIETYANADTICSIVIVQPTLKKTQKVSNDSR